MIVTGSLNRAALMRALAYLETARTVSKQGVLFSAGVVRHNGRLKVLLEASRWNDDLASSLVRNYRTEYKNGSTDTDPFFDSSGWIERLS